MEWFTVGKKGLRKLLEHRGRVLIIHKLLQNACDEDTGRVAITLEPLGGDRARLVVEDDSPDGFRDLTHAHTLVRSVTFRLDCPQPCRQPAPPRSRHRRNYH